MSKHILVISQYFYPEQFRINDICIEWVRRGYEVTVVTGIPNYPQGEFYEGYDKKNRRHEIWNGINIIRLPILPRKRGAINLVLNYFSFVWSGFVWKLRTKIKADCVYIYEVSPMTQALVGIWYAKKVKVPCLLYVTDLWPDNVEIVTGIHNKFIIGAINSMVKYIYHRCDKIFTSSKSFLTKIMERGVPIQKLQFWPQYAEDFYIPINYSEKNELKTDRDEVLKIVFAGNIGYAQGLKTVVGAACILKEKGILVKFVIIGDGRYKETMMLEVKEKCVDSYFEFIARQPAESIPSYMAECDAALICLAKSEVFAMTIPAKTQSCMACGMLILVSADGEVQDIIKEAKCGFVSAAEDAEGLSESIAKLNGLAQEEKVELRRNALEFYQDNFDKKKLLDEMDVYLKGNI